MCLGRYRSLRGLIFRSRIDRRYWYSIPGMARDHDRSLYSVLFSLLRSPESVEPPDAAPGTEDASTALHHLVAPFDGSVHLGQ